MSEPAKKKQRRNEAWTCKHCGLPAKDVVGARTATQADLRGEHLVHQRLCLGVGVDGDPLGLPRECPACLHAFQEPTPKAWLCHWARCQPEKKLTDTYTLKEIRLDFSRHLLPSTDMNGKFGLVLSRRMPLWHDKELLSIQASLGGDQLKSVYAANGLLQSLRDEFKYGVSRIPEWNVSLTQNPLLRSFFQGAIVIQLASHVSSIQPTTILSSIACLEAPLSDDVDQVQVAPRRGVLANVAVVERAYGASTGPLVRWNLILR